MLGRSSAPILTVDGLQFKDLNRNGRLDAYEDWRLTPEARVKDLVQQMTLQEKAGLMMHGTLRSAGGPGAPGAGKEYDFAAAEKVIVGTAINSFITRLGGDPANLARQNNKIQELAEKARLGIPATISTDPRNHFQYTAGASAERGRFSQWPESLGLGAIRDPELVRQFADIARQEYLAVGITEALSPQADLATEPRWARINGTFGEDAELAKADVQAYVEGFQQGGKGLHPGSVITVVKHWVGYGAQVNGLDSHNPYGRYAAFPGNNFPYHVIPFEGAFSARVAAIMPTYSILQGVEINGQPVEPVGANYSKVLLTDLLRNQMHFQGVILTDWGVTEDCSEKCLNGAPAGVAPSFEGFGTDWGVADLSKEDRFAKAVRAGVDQFGGTEDAAQVVAAVKDGKIPESRLDESVSRILLQKYQLGLFENAYVAPDAAAKIVGNPAFQQQADAAQRRSLVLLKNQNHTLPLKAEGQKVYLHNIDAKVAAAYGLTVVDTPEKADFAIFRVTAPFQILHPGFVFGSRQHEGNLGFLDGSPDYEAIKSAAAKVPTIVTIYLDRPAILTNIQDKAAAIVGNFGVSDANLLEVLTGKAKPEGKLPFELPSSMAEVEAQRGDVPHDTAHPLYAFGFGLAY
jgi:beta-glucosidase